jgi:hypothetical protein
MTKKEKAEVTQVGPMDPKKKNSPIKEGSPQEAGTHGQGETKDPTCYFNGVGYSAGAYVCSTGRLLYCERSGYWSYQGSC